MAFGEGAKTLINEEEAQFVRRLRVEDECSWGGAGEMADAWGTSWDSNQGAGLFLCEAAACRLREDPNADPWN